MILDGNVQRVCVPWVGWTAADLPAGVEGAPLADANEVCARPGKRVVDPRGKLAAAASVPTVVVILRLPLHVYLVVFCICTNCMAFWRVWQA